MKTFKPNSITAALISSGMLLSSGVVFAQEAQQQTDQQAEEQQVEVIEVSGFRRSLIKAQAIKASETSVVEAISAEDIGKLPDSSIAESLARMPGLAAQRLDGRASRVSVRGFSENESATTFNGREQVSIYDSRGVEFDLYPSEIMDEVVVYKTPDASLEAEGIAGVIDLRTVKPLSRDERVVQVNGQMEMTSFDKLNPDGDDKGYRATFSYIDKFADDKVGVAVAVTTMKSPNQEERWNSWGSRNIGLISSWGAAVDANGVAGDDDRILEGAKPFVRSSLLERDSIMAVAEFKPTDKLHMLADALYVDFSDQKILRGIEIPGVWADGSSVANAVTDGVVTQGTITNQPVVRNDYEERKATLKSFGLNAEYFVNDEFKVEGDVSVSKVDRTIWSMENYSGYGDGRGSALGPQDTITYVTDPSLEGVKFNPTFDYSDWSMMRLGGPLSWGNGVTVPSDGQDGFINAPNINGELTTAKVAVTQYLESEYLSSLIYGMSYKDRSKTKTSEGYYMTLKAYPDTLPVPEQYRVGVADLSFIGMGDMIAYDSRALVADGFYDLIAESETKIDHLLKSWDVSEEVTALFVQANIDAQIAGMPLTGNIGLRHIRTTQTSNGFAGYIEDGLVKAQAVNIEHDFNKTLPSLNLKLALDDTQSVRLGIAKTISRARMDEMNASLNVSYDESGAGGTAWSVSGGNPLLEPKEATGFDLSYENYFSAAGYFSIAAYYKDINKWIFDGAGVIDLGDVTAPDGSAPINTLATVSGKANGGSGSLHGFEFAISYSLGELTDVLDGFGVIASHSIISSNIKDPGGNKYKIPGLSDKMTNLTFYYEKDGFSARTSMRKRADFKGDIYTIGFNVDQFDIAGETLWDAQVAYDFGEAGFDSLKGLSIFLQGQNLTDEPFVTYSEGAVRDYQSYGSTYLLGFSYKL